MVGEGPMESQTIPPQHGSTRQSPPSGHSPAASAGPEGVSEGLDMFDLQLLNDCRNIPGSFVTNFGASSHGLPPSPTAVHAAETFSSAATASSCLAATMSNPQLARCLVKDVAQVVLRYISSRDEPQPEKLSEEYERQLILQLAEELHRTSMPQPGWMVSGGDGRLTIDKEVVLSLRNGREGFPPGADVPRPHHPYVGWCASNGSNISPRAATLSTGAAVPQQMCQGQQPIQQPHLWRGTPPTVVCGGLNGNNVSSTTGSGNNAANVRLGECSSTAVAHNHVSLTATSLSRRLASTGLFRPQPQHPRNSARGLADRRHVTTSTKKVLRSASSAFSECSAGETGEVSSLLSRTTAGTNRALR
uniref:Uncharacterized protein n=1 Tax=Trypanosoma congolense (strain IL3000) TaxID=1068625 RepID=G0UMT6_TRYCI|nr:conserved hypothetical protein [Trypanosoma congolense IL3000]